MEGRSHDRVRGWRTHEADQNRHVDRQVHAALVLRVHHGLDRVRRVEGRSHDRVRGWRTHEADQNRHVDRQVHEVVAPHDHFAQDLDHPDVGRTLLGHAAAESVLKDDPCLDRGWHSLSQELPRAYWLPAELALVARPSFLPPSSHRCFGWRVR